MDKQKFFKRLAYLIFFIFIVNYLAGKFYWYSAIWWFDMPMHFLGGFWLGLVSIWFLSYKESSPPERPFVRAGFRFIFEIILTVFLIGIFWELYEVLFYNYLAQNPFNIPDTISDIFFDLVGGLCAILYVLVPFKNQRTGSKE